MSTEQSTVEAHDQAAIESIGGDGVAAAEDTLTVTDNRTGRTYELPITDGTVRAMDLRQIKTDDQDFGLMAYDPAFMNTASCRSAITYIDGDAGILQHRGYPIEQLCEHSTYLEVAYLLINGELPTHDELDGVGRTRSRSTRSCTRTSRTSCRASATTPTRWACSSPRSARCRPSTRTPTRSTSERRPRDPDHPAAREDADAGRVRLPPQHGPALRLPRQRPRLRRQLPRDDVQDDRAQIRARSSPRACARRALHPARRPRTERLHERRARRRLDPGRPLLGGRRRASPRCTGRCTAAPTRRRCECSQRIGSVENIPDFLEGVKAGNERLMGFGHRVYKNYDPRARIIRKYLDDVFEVRGKSPLLEVATELEKRALDDDYFTSRKLYPNVDFYSGLIYEALGLPVAMFPVMFAIGRTSGWIAQWLEMVEDPEQKIARPRQIYTGDARPRLRPDRAARLGRQHERRAVAPQPVAVVAVARASAAPSSAQKRREWSRISRWQTSCQTTYSSTRSGASSSRQLKLMCPSERARRPARALARGSPGRCRRSRRARWRGPGAGRSRCGRRAGRSARAPAAGSPAGTSSRSPLAVHPRAPRLRHQLQRLPR